MEWRMGLYGGEGYRGKGRREGQEQGMRVTCNGKRGNGVLRES